MSKSEMFEKISPYVIGMTLLTLSIWWNISLELEVKAADKLSNSKYREYVIYDNNGLFKTYQFGFELICGKLNTGKYGYHKTVDDSLPIWDSAHDIFESMGQPEGSVMVIKGQELSFQDVRSGNDYSSDANGTIYCVEK